VKAQVLSEVEEVIEYKKAKSDDFSEITDLLKGIWTKRLLGMQRNVEAWRSILVLRSMVLTPDEDFKNWLKYASLCRKANHAVWSRKVLLNLLGGTDPYEQPSASPSSVSSSVVPSVTVSSSTSTSVSTSATTLINPPPVLVLPGGLSTATSTAATGREQLDVKRAMILFSWLKHCWDVSVGSDERKQHVEHLKNLCKRTRTQEEGANHLLARCYLTLGRWQNELNDNLNEVHIYFDSEVCFIKITILVKRCARNDITK
jgi:hypothetical protein